MKTAIAKSEKGQSLILFAILFVVLVGILAIIIDTANAYNHRRVAQNAADAGALAAARVYCDNPVIQNQNYAGQVCNDYVENNNAKLIPGYPDFDGNTITVGTTITVDTFLGRILGQDQLVVKAQAKAGCSAPCLGEGVLPVVWICNPSHPEPGSKECDELPITWDKLLDYRDSPGSTPDCQPIGLRGGRTGYICPELTIVMDNIDLEYLQCQSSGGVIDCDFNNDDKDDYLSASNRGWADLDGNLSYSCTKDKPGEGVDELRQWIFDGYKCQLDIDTWVGDQETNALWGDVEERRKTNPIVVLPVFNESCPDDPRYTTEDCIWHSGPIHPPADVVHDFTNAENYYHINAFSAFYITCVQTQKGDCPGATRFYEENVDCFKGPPKPGCEEINGADYNAIEGYFLTGYIPGLKGDCGDDIGTGVFTVHLDPTD